MLSPGNALETDQLRKSHKYASCWRIARSDGTVFRYTDHDRPLTVLTDPDTLTFETFTPALGVQSSAREFDSQLNSTNTDFRGVISSSDITEADLYDGLFTGALVIEYVIRWDAPWLGAFQENHFTIGQVRFTQAVWEAEASGLIEKLKQKKGKVYAPHCPYDLGDADCGFDIAAAGMEITDGTVDSIDTQRLKFRATSTNSNFATPNFYDRGKITWLTGNNAGLEDEVEIHDNPLASVPNFADLELFVRTRNNIQVGDTFELIPGCNKKDGHVDSTGDCLNKYSNLANFGGFQFIPGTDRMLESP